MTWIPIVLEFLPEEEPIDAHQWTEEGILDWWPVADYKTGPRPHVGLPADRR